MARFELSAVAADDLLDIFVYGTEQWGLPQAHAYYDSLLDHLARIASDPYRYPAVTDIRIGLRRSVFKAHSVYFMIDPEAVNIRAIQRSQRIERIR